MSYHAIVCQSDAEWHEQRRQGIGASEAAAIIGASPWASALSVWARKLGLDDEAADNEPIEWGQALEPVIADKYARVTGRALADFGRLTVLVSGTWPWMRCTLDRVILDGSRYDGVLEIKTTGAQMARKWEDEGVPRHYYLQVQHQLAVTGYRWGSIAVLIGGQKFRYADVPRDDAVIAELVEAERAFWHGHVLTQEPPQPDGTEQTRALLARLYPTPTTPDAPPVVLPPDAAEWDAQRCEAEAQLKHWNAKKNEAENRLKAAIADAPGGQIPGGAVYLWTPQARNAYSVPASTTRVLRRKESAA